MVKTGITSTSFSFLPNLLSLYLFFAPFFLQIMEKAKKDKEQLIILCHWPLINLWTPDFESSLLWNAEEVLQMLDPEGIKIR